MTLESGIIEWRTTVRSSLQHTGHYMVYAANPVKMVVVKVPSRTSNKVHNVIVYADETAICPCRGYSLTKKCIHAKMALAVIKNATVKLDSGQINTVHKLLTDRNYESFIKYINDLTEEDPDNVKVTLWSLIGDTYHKDLYPSRGYTDGEKKFIQSKIAL